MKREVRVSPDAAFDLVRLTEFLAEKSPASALRAGEKVKAAMRSLDTLSERGRPVEGGRELDVRFGRYVYIIVYRVDPETVIVARIFHSHEDRSSGPR